MDAYRGVVAADPENPRAWLRIGNLHHRRSQWLSAASAYRRAADRSEGVPDEAPLRLKALLNLASVNLELAADALAQAETSPGAGPDTDALRREVREQWQSMSRRAAGRQQAAEAAQGAPSPAPRPPSSRRSPASQPASAAPTGRDVYRGPAIEYLTGAPGP